MAYPNLQRLLRERRISAPMVAPVINVTPRAASNKISGVTDFTVEEAKGITSIFPEYDWRYLFATEDELQADTQAAAPAVV